MKRKLIFNITPLKYRRQSLRIKSTLAEKILWERLRRKNLGFKFFRQYSVEGYVIDFYCPEKRLAIELEGKIHNLPQNRVYDRYRFKYLEAYSIKILRFNNEEVYGAIGNVIETIKNNLSSPS